MFSTVTLLLFKRKKQLEGESTLFSVVIMPQTLSIEFNLPKRCTCNSYQWVTNKKTLLCNKTRRFLTLVEDWSTKTWRIGWVTDRLCWKVLNLCYLFDLTNGLENGPVKGFRRSQIRCYLSFYGWGKVPGVSQSHGICSHDCCQMNKTSILVHQNLHHQAIYLREVNAQKMSWKVIVSPHTHTNLTQYQSE